MRPDATATLSEWDGSMRRAFNEPSSGSTTTVTPEPGSPNATSPRSSEIDVEAVTLIVELLELAEDDLLAAPIEGQRPIAPLPDAGVDGPGRDPALLGEQLAMGGDDSPAGAEPIRLQRVRVRPTAGLLNLPGPHPGDAR